MTTYEAYQHQLARLTPEEKIQVNVREGNIGRKLQPWEIFSIFKLEPSGGVKLVKRRMSDQIEESKDWMD